MGRPQGAFKGATDAANELAQFIQNLTGPLTVRELATRYGGGRTLWSEYRSGAKAIPLGVLNSVLRDQIRDARGCGRMLDQARRLHDAVLVAEVQAVPVPRLKDTLQRTEADLDAAGRVIQSLLALIAMLLPDRTEPQPVPGSVLLSDGLDQLDAALAVRAAAARVGADGEDAGQAARTNEGGGVEIPLATMDLPARRPGATTENDIPQAQSLPRVQSGTTVGAPVRGHQQSTVLQRQAPRPTPGTASVPSRREIVTSFPKACGLSPVNAAIQDGSNAAITPATSRSFRLPTLSRVLKPVCSANREGTWDWFISRATATPAFRMFLGPTAALPRSGWGLGIMGSRNQRMALPKALPPVGMPSLPG